MRKALRFCSAACVVAIGVVMLAPTAASAQALNSYLKIKGAKQGALKEDKEKTPSATRSNVAIQKATPGSIRRR